MANPEMGSSGRFEKGRFCQPTCMECSMYFVTL